MIFCVQASLVLLILCPCVVFSHILGIGKCKNIDGMKDFDLDKFLEEPSWNIIEIFGGVSKCMKEDFVRNEENGLDVTQVAELAILNNLGIPSWNPRSFSAKVTIEDPINNPAKMTINWSINLLGSARFVVVDTDYTSYALIYECQSLWPLSRRSVAILGRENNLDGERMQIIYNKVKEIPESVSNFNKINHENCKVDSSDSATNIGDELFGEEGEPSDPFGILTKTELDGVTDQDNMIAKLKSKLKETPVSEWIKRFNETHFANLDVMMADETHKVFEDDIQ